MKIEKTNSEEYEWGQKCKGWHLVNTNELSIIQELMPRGTEEIKHMHSMSQQFFYILKGKATFIVDGKEFEVDINQGIHIKPNIVHQIKNKTIENLEFIVISQPHSHGDRINKID
jgi:mannose-6-phosphate isomerase-like protein (cupin superfamily)